MPNAVYREVKLSYFLNEILDVEASFIRHVKIISSIFEKLREHYPEEQIIEKYDYHLKEALPYFETIGIQSHSIYQDPTLNLTQKVQQVTALYYSGIYYQMFSRLILLYSQFERWGAEIKYEKWVQAKKLFPTEIIQGLYDKYSPSIFIQHLPQILLVVHEFAEQTEDPKIQVVEHALNVIIVEINERKRKMKLIEEVSHLLNRRVDRFI
jgi:hypothetical protein